MRKNVITKSKKQISLEQRIAREQEKLQELNAVMEARKQSGSLTTVDWALKQGKDVFAYPGDPSLPLYNEGNH